MSGAGAARRRGPSLPIAIGILALAVAVFAPVRNFDFVGADDNPYVARNPVVRAGLTGEGLRWSLSTLHAGNWHPLTWISLMADVSLFGVDPGALHLVNLGLHALGALSLFAALLALTGAPWRSGAVAALFAVHPLHVESVAWIAERKDVLSGLFGMLSLWAYARYARRPGRGRFLTLAAFFVLGLLAKPILVTLPLLFLLLDYWPLGRWTGGGGGPVSRAALRAQAPRLLREKSWLLLLAAAAGVATMLAQRQAGAVVPLAALPLGPRVANALTSTVTYLAKTLWPAALAVYYPHPGAIPLWRSGGAAAVLLALSWWLVRQARRLPYATAGWFWYLVVLVPVSGLVQAGAQGMADRYTYLSLTGLFVAAVWGLADLRRGLPPRNPARALPVVAVVVALCAAAPAARLQVMHWRDAVSLFAHAAEVVPNNAVALMSLGAALAARGRSEEAIERYREAVRAAPGNAAAAYNLGVEYARLGRVEEAVAAYRQALRVRPGYAAAHNNLGALLLDLGRREEAAVEFREALRADPSFAAAAFNLELAVGAPGAPARGLDR